MKHVLFVIVSSILAVCAVTNLPAQAKNDPKAEALVKTIENRQDLSGLDITSQFTLVQKREGETDRILRLDIFRRDSKDVFTIVFRYPDSEKGKGYLRNGDDLYFYLPSTREFVYRNRKDDIGSTDVRTDIFSRPNTLEQYTVAMAGEEKVAEWTCTVIKLTAKTLDVSFPIQKWYVRKTDNLPVKIDNFSLSETILRTVYYIAYQDLENGRVTVTKLLSVNPLEKGQKTLLSNDNVSRKPIQDYVFTKAYLEEQSR